ncbi:ATP-binding protein [Patescibacteria group bacterium]|nr:ATP-binding protein [Patescibacteria group bacterium]MBU1499613.1 ATP-binding protein [Patescibacteria group bacterium]
MYDTQQLIKIIDFWEKTVFESDLIFRPIVDKIDYKSKETIDIIGPRRSGKSSILKLLIKKLGVANFLFINFEDPYFVTHNEPQVVEELIDIYKEYFSRNLKYLFFDEIHVINHWENAIRKLRDSGKYKIFVTGSSSKLLGKELSTLLTGRHISYEILPLSFSEFLSFKGIELKGKKDLVIKEKSILKNFDEYLSIGGFPEIVKTGNLALLKQYYFDIIQKDIVMRYDVRQKNILEKMGIYLITNLAKTVSIESLKNTFNLSFEAVSDYLDYFEEAFLIYELPQFSYSLKTQQQAQKKIYSIDSGLANTISFRFSEEKGRLLEQCVFLELKRKGYGVYYYKTKNNKEVDFLVRQQSRKKDLIQVCWDISDENTKKREFDSLTQAMNELKLTNSLVLTYNSDQKIQFKNKTITLMPVFKWLIDSE